MILPVTISANLTDRYECLRRNALGELNQPYRLLLFLQQGMSCWLRAIDSKIPTMATSGRLPAAADVTDKGIAHILVDAILETRTKPHGQCK